MPTPPFAAEIRKTGFVLENEVAQVLRAGWTVISNKYYVDDSEEAVREIDLVKREVDLGKPALYWDNSTNAPRVGFELPDDVIAHMNEDAEIKKYIAGALKTTYRYDGPFSISLDIPF